VKAFFLGGVTKHFPKGLDNRMRDKNGEIRKQRDDTQVGTSRKQYGDNFAKGYSTLKKSLALLKKSSGDYLEFNSGIVAELGIA
jgi:hypothetical protein